MPRLFINIAGQKFGKLTAIKQVGRDDHGHVLWECSCECGGTKVAPATHLLRGHTQSCGCLGNWKARNLSSREYLVQYLTRYWKRTAAKRGLLWAISPETFNGLVFQNCSWCGQPPSQVIVRKGTTFRHTGIDRLNNRLGYVEGNVVACCKICNSMKSDLSQEDFLVHLRRIVRKQGQLWTTF